MMTKTAIFSGVTNMPSTFSVSAGRMITGSIFNLLRYGFSRYLTAGDYTLPLTLELNNGSMMELRIMPYSQRSSCT